MNEKLRQQLSAYLDNQLQADERRQLEARLTQDPEARSELATLRQLAAWIGQTAPTTVSVPADFRTRVMDRLKLESGGPGKNPGASGGNPAPGGKVPPYWIAGAVLVGFLGTVIYLDSLHQPLPNPAQTARMESLPVAAGGEGAGAAPLPSAGPASAGVSARDLQGSGRVVAGKSSEPGPVAGQVYTVGQGGADKMGSVQASVPNSGRGTSTDISEPGPVTVALEESSGWTLTTVRLNLPAARAHQAGQMLDLSQRYNLNPGLLLAAAADFPERGLTELAMRLRSTLQATRGLNPHARLVKLITALGGDPGRASAWEKKLRP